jgi:S-adenosyl methyltransferase
MRENRQFLSRAARWAAGQGITQFIDLGCGAYSSGGVRAYHHPVADFASFFGPQGGSGP